MTFWWSDDNYGQLLQCFALQKYLRAAGHDAFIIRYRYSIGYKRKWSAFFKIFNPKLVYKEIKKLYKITKAKKDHEKNPRNFGEFRQKYIRVSDVYYSSFPELSQNPPDADVYITGSDQVWNVHSNPQESIPAYFLDFGSKSVKRMSYAASFGINKIDQRLQDDIKKMLSKFYYVSVREKKGLELCQNIGIRNAELVPDPTLLLTSSEYRSLYNENAVSVPKEKYCFVYMLNNKCDFSMGKISKWAKENNLTVKYVTGNLMLDKYEKMYPSIPEWLCLLDNADYVITNSFHCCVFSLLFHKQFACIPLKGNIYEGMNSRLDSLFDQFGVNRYIDQNYSILKDQINWNIVDVELDKLRNSVRFLDILSKLEHNDNNYGHDLF